MAELTLDEARDLLMAHDVLPMSQSENEQQAPQDLGSAEWFAAFAAAGEGASEEDEALALARAQDDAAFAAVLDAAFGAESEVAGEAEAPSTSEGRVLDSASVGLGVDIVEIERMQNILARRPDFAQKVFSPEECAYCDSRPSSAAHYAVRFAAKEAVVKALGTGFTGGIGVRDIEVERARSGRPTVRLSGVAQAMAQRLGVLDIALSMSYTKVDAVACAFAMTRAAVVATEARKDPMEELTRQFKETRKMLDEL